MLNNLFHKPQSNKFRVLSVFWPASIRGWKIEAGICQFLIYCWERDFTLFLGGGCGVGGETSSGRDRAGYQIALAALHFRPPARVH